MRVLNEEGLLWTDPMPVSPQALLQRLRSVPPVLFANIMAEVLPEMQARWTRRTRPLPEALRFATKHFTAVLALDGSTLDALSKKVGLLQGTAGNVLAGRMAALLDVVSLLPRKLWFEEDSKAHEDAPRGPCTFPERHHAAGGDRRTAFELLLGAGCALVMAWGGPVRLTTIMPCVAVVVFCFGLLAPTLTHEALRP